MGAKHAFELWPEPLVARCRATRRRKAAPEHRALVAAATAALAAFEARHSGAGGAAGAPLAARKEREELETRLALLAELDKGHTDHGAPFAGALPWHACHGIQPLSVRVNASVLVGLKATVGRLSD